jgi:hypothetical protein
LITEYADGGDLYQRILEYQQRGRYMSESFLWMLAVQLSQALLVLYACPYCIGTSKVRTFFCVLTA